MPFDNDDELRLIDSKYYNINELNSLQTKQNYFGILYLNIASLNKHRNYDFILL